MARRGGYVLARIVRAIGLFIVGVLVLYIILVVLDANFGNAFASVVRGLADTFDLGLSDLFLPANPKLMVALNYGLAAIIWLAITSVVTRLLSRA